MNFAKFVNIVGVCGSGRTTLAKKLVELSKKHDVVSEVYVIANAPWEGVTNINWELLDQVSGDALLVVDTIVPEQKWEKLQTMKLLIVTDPTDFERHVPKKLQESGSVTIRL